MTGNVRRFVSNLTSPSFDISERKGLVVINEPFVLITYTTGFGEVPKEVETFLSNSYPFLKAVIGSGNRNWGANFCKGAKSISKKYNVPLLHEFELSGTREDIRIVTDKIREFEKG